MSTRDRQRHQERKPRTPFVRGSSYAQEAAPYAAVSGNVKIVVTLMALVLAVACLRLVYLTLIAGPSNAEIAKQIHTVQVELLAKRGTIYDRNNNVLAMSVECRMITCNPAQIKDPIKTANVIGQVLGGTGSDYIDALTADSQFAYVKRKVDTSKADELREALIENECSTGIYIDPDMKRVYPYGAVAAQVLGLVNSEGQGATGLELQYNDILSGTNGMRIREVSNATSKAPSTPIAGGIYTEEPAVNGTDIVISLDIDIQQIAEAQIAKGVEDYKAESGFVTVTEPKTGEILAMCSTPFLDPDNTAEVDPASLTLGTVAHSYEPGSVMKILTCAIGFENNIFSPSTTFGVPASIQVGDDTVHDDDDRSVAMDMDPREVMRRSSNVGAVILGQQIGIDTYRAGMAAFGIGADTGIDYPGEVPGLITSADDFTDTTLGVMSFGQGMAIPMIQTVRAVGAIANRGILTTPHFLVYEGNQKVDWPEGGRACSAQTAQEVTDVMETVIKDGTGRKAAVTGYEIAGKTGTGEQASEEGGYKQWSYLASLVGFAPAKDPEVLVYVALNGVAMLASDSAAPVFSAIMGEALLDMGVAPTATE